jgi:hypothetical protein
MKFFSDFSLWWSIPMLVVAFAISAWFYLRPSREKLFSTRVSRVLFLLRGFSLFLILFLLLGILLQSVRFRSEKPVLVVMVDQSESMMNYADSAEVRSQLTSFLEEMSTRLESKMDVEFIPFSGEVDDSIDLRFSGQSTDMSRAFRDVRESFIHRNVGALVVISDGNFNQGMHPRFEAEKFAFTPIYSIAVGDTLTKRDAALLSVVANQIAFQGNVFPLKVEGTAAKLNGKNLTISVKQGNKVLAEKNLVVSGNSFSFAETFQLTASGKGVQAFSVLIRVNEDEYTLSNNERTVYIEVLESKRKICILSGGIHPDIGALQSLLQKDKNTEVELVLFKDVRELPKADLFIVHNPVNGFSQPIWSAIQSGDTPYLVIVGTTGETTTYNQLELGMSGVSQGKFDAAFASFAGDFSLIRFSDEFKKRVAEFPPLSVPFARNFKELGSTLLIQRIGSVKTDRPLLSLVDRGGRKYAILYGEGIWRWRMSEYNKYQNNQAFEELWDKLLQYLTVKRNTDKLRVFPPTQSSDRDELSFRAEFYNDAFQLITDPKIQLQLLDENDTKLADYQFNPRQSDYVLNLGKWKGGLYKWKAFTSYNGKKYDKSGELVVTSSSVEKLKLVSDFGVMNELAQLHQGEFVLWKDRANAIDQLLVREDIQSVRYEESAFSNLMDLKWLFFLLFILLTSEWFVRRWFGTI